MLKKLLLLLATIPLIVLVACGGQAPVPTVAIEPTAEPPEPAAEEEMEATEAPESTEEPPVTAEPEATEAPEPTVEPAAEEEMASIADIAAENGNFTTLITALEATGLIDTLSGEGEFTVFAPTDDAFAALPAGTVENLLADPAGGLTDVLLYHVIEGTVTSDQVVELDSATTLQGEDITISVTDGNVMLNDSVMVTTTDIEAGNGVIHIIDGVLLPADMAASVEEGGETAGEVTEETIASIADVAAGEEELSTLVDILNAAGLIETLSGEGEFTVFAPTNAAFEALPSDLVNNLMADPTGSLNDVLLYHVVEGTVTSDQVAEMDSAMTLEGEDIRISVTDGNVMLNDSVMVTTTDIEAGNGVIHIIDSVLLPPSLSGGADTSADEALASIAEMAADNENLSTLLTALNAAGLSNILGGDNQFTVFAPNDEAFTNLPEGTLNSLMADPANNLRNALLYHIVKGTYTADQIAELDSLKTLTGDDITITVTDEGVMLNDSVMVVTTDIEASNGVIHIIDGVLTPAE